LSETPDISLYIHSLISPPYILLKCLFYRGFAVIPWFSDFFSWWHHSTLRKLRIIFLNWQILTHQITSRTHL